MKTLRQKFVAETEPWIIVKLDKTMARLIITDVLRELNDKGNPAFNANGEAVYRVASQVITAVQEKIKFDA